MTTIADNLQQVQARIVTACTAAGRDPASVRLLAVSKTFAGRRGARGLRRRPACLRRELRAGGVAKIEALADLRDQLEWHCIGPLQSNKTRAGGRAFRLGAQRRPAEDRRSACPSSGPAHLPPLQVCLQVNIDGGANKSGVAPDEALGAGARRGGVAAVAAARPDGDSRAGAGFRAQRALFLRARPCSTQLRAAGLALDTLSMGMRADLEAAIAAGSTMVRVGTAIFGQR